MLFEWWGGAGGRDRALAGAVSECCLPPARDGPLQTAASALLYSDGNRQDLTLKRGCDPETRMTPKPFWELPIIPWKS